jgi:hypothetical protein
MTTLVGVAGKFRLYTHWVVAFPIDWAILHDFSSCWTDREVIEIEMCWEAILRNFPFLSDIMSGIMDM